MFKIPNLFNKDRTKALKSKKLAEIVNVEFGCFLIKKRGYQPPKTTDKRLKILKAINPIIKVSGKF